MAGIFEHTIAYVEDLGAFWPLERAAREAGVLGLAIKLHDAGGNPLAAANRQRLEQGDQRRLAELGYKVGPWSCPRLEPESSAEIVSRLYGELSLSFVVFETEQEYKSDGGGIDVARLWRRWRQLRPRAYTAAAVQGNMPHTYNFGAGVTAGVHFLPENYWLQDGSYDATPCLAAAVALGIPLERVHLTLTGVEGHAMSEALVRAYAAALVGATLDVRGVALWRGDQLTPDDYRLVGLAHGLARPRS